MSFIKQKKFQIPLFLLAQVLCLGLPLLIFQNCSRFENKTLGFYYYNSEPDFFWDLKLMRSYRDEQFLTHFLFDFVAAYVKDPFQQVQYNISFHTSSKPNVCRSVQGSFSKDTNHLRVPPCTLAVKEKLQVRLVLQGPQEERFERILEY